MMIIIIIIIIHLRSIFSDMDVISATYYSNTMYSMPSELYVSSNSTMCGCFSMWHIVASRFRSAIRKANRKYEPIESSENFRINRNMMNSPDVLRPGLAVNFATSTILTANCNLDSRCMHRRTIEKGPLQIDQRKKKLVIFSEL